MGYIRFVELRVWVIRRNLDATAITWVEIKVQALYAIDANLTHWLISTQTRTKVRAFAGARHNICVFVRHMVTWVEIKFRAPYAIDATVDLHTGLYSSQDHPFQLF